MSYITTKILPTISLIEFIDKRECARVVIEKNLKAFIIDMMALKIVKAIIYLLYIAQIIILQ